MGSWFSNLHIRKNGTVTEETIVNYINNLMTARQFLPAESEADADGTVAIVDGEECQWFSVYSDLFSHDDLDSCKAVAMPMSAELHTDVMGISCFDSDYLYLNLFNAEDKTDAWVGIGRGGDFGIKRCTGVSAWKKKVSDYPVFAAKAKEQYIYAEEFLAEIESCIDLPMMQSAASLEYMIDLGLDKKATYLYFKRSDNAEVDDLPKLQLWSYSGMPCFDGKSSFVEALNHGGEGKGLSVFFVGPYVEREEITFTNVKMMKWVRGEAVAIPIQLEKVQLTEGQWAYYYHDPQYKFLPKAPDRAPIMKQKERSIYINFTPVGNSRKMLDITVVFVPDQNPLGQTGWNVWHAHGSKKAFIEYHNKIWKRVRAVETNPDSCLPLLKEEDFD